MKNYKCPLKNAKIILFYSYIISHAHYTHINAISAVGVQPSVKLHEVMISRLFDIHKIVFLCFLLSCQKFFTQLFFNLLFLLLQLFNWFSSASPALTSTTLWQFHFISTCLLLNISSLSLVFWYFNLRSTYSLPPVWNHPVAAKVTGNTEWILSSMLSWIS